jgi:hypothetical protein
MKNKRFALTRVVAGVTVTALLAACGAGSESSDTTERTRNTTLWSASTVPTKVVVYGTQDGLVEYVQVPSESGEVTPTNIATESMYGPLNASVVSVAVDSSRSHIIYAGMFGSSDAELRMATIGVPGATSIFSAPSTQTYGMGYDPSSRVAALNHFDGSRFRYVLHSIDEIESPLVNSTHMFYMVPNINSTRTLISTNSNIREVNRTNPESVIDASDSLAAPPFDMWNFAQDTQSSSVYAARPTAGELVQTQASSSAPLTKIATFASPATLAVFSDGTLAIGKGANTSGGGSIVGALSVYDPSGTSPTIEMSGVGSGAPASGLQSVWAVESPIANTPPQVDGDSVVGGSIYCGDAQWRDDLPLSRLSRKPIEGVRSYAWFRNGVQMEGVTSETIELSEGGSYQCAVTAGNLAGSGQSAQSEAIDVPSSPSDESTSTTVEGSGGSEASPVESPVVTVPVAAPATPVVVVTPSLRSVKWTFTGRTVKVTFRKYSGATKYRLYVRGATRKNIVCKSAKTTVTCTTTTLKKGLNSFSAKALSTSGVTLALSTKTRITK